MEVKVGLIVVAYKNPSMTIRFVKEEVPKIKLNFFLVIINVAATEQESRELAEKCNLFYEEKKSLLQCSHQGVVISSPSNLGYAKGNNLAVKYLKEKNIRCDYYLFSNDDVEFLSPNLIPVLIEKAKVDKNIAGIGPRVKCIDGMEGSPVRMYYSPMAIILNTIRCKIRKKDRNFDPIDIREGRVYWVSGAFMLVKAFWFDLVGGFDNRTFLYYEEPILAEKFKKHGAYFYYTPNVSILHYEGGSTVGKVRNAQKRWIVEQSRILYYKDYIHVNNFYLFMYKIYCKIKFNFKKHV